MRHEDIRKVVNVFNSCNVTENEIINFLSRLHFKNIM